MSDWRTMDTAPKDGTKILVTTVHGAIEISEWYVSEGDEYIEIGDGIFRKERAVWHSGWNSNYPAFWKPLPEPAPEADVARVNAAIRADMGPDPFRMKDDDDE